MRGRRKGRATKVLLLVGIALLAVPQLAAAVITFDQLDDDLFVVSHRVKVKFWMSRGQAVRKVYEKAASLCLATGYSHLEVLRQESEAHQWDDDANAHVTVRFFAEDGDRRIECRPLASARYIEQANVKLAKRGFRGPPPTTAPADQSETD